MKGIVMHAEPETKPVIPNSFRDLPDSCNDISDRLLPQVIKILSRTDQTLVWFDSLICPVRSIVPRSEKDIVMHTIADKLKALGIIEYHTGFHSNNSDDGGHYYVTSCVLTDEFFNNKPGTQLKLF